MWEYKNGNTQVTLLDDGTKIREYESVPELDRPESMDIKITDYCDAGCAFCHENSTEEGKHGSVEYIKSLFDFDCYGMELAIGGGNPMSHPQLNEILRFFQSKGIVSNITVNAMHIKKELFRIKRLQEDRLLYGVGVSYRKPFAKDCIEASDLLKNCVIHFINGIDSDLAVNLFKGKNVLILGYKTFGRGAEFLSPFVERQQKKMNMRIHKLINDCRVSFDNLGIEQLNPQRFFKEEEWQKMFMGEEGYYTMYVDAVKKEFAISSYSKERYPGVHLIDFFKAIKTL